MTSLDQTQRQARVVKSPTAWERKATEQAVRDFGNSPAGREVTTLKQQVQRLTQKIDQLRGENGIEVKGSIITLHIRKPATDGQPGPITNNEITKMPFDVIDDGTNLLVIPGQLNGVAPDTVGGADDWTFTHTPGKIFLKVVITDDTNDVTTRELKKAGSVPAPTSDGTSHTGYLELATITETSGELFITQAYNGSQWASVDWGKVTCSDGTLSQTATLNW